jgi:hypothetical protein
LGEFSALGDKKIWKILEIFFEKSPNFGNHKTEKENIGGK